MALKPVTSSVENQVKGTWEKGLSQAIREEVIQVELYSPPKDLINEFESRRNELDRSLGGRKLQTIHAFVTVHISILPKVLSKGFYRALGNQKIAFSTDPHIAITEGGGGNNNKIVLCRVTLGREGTDYQVVRNKYIVDNLRGIMPSFLLTYAVPGEALSLQQIILDPVETHDQAMEDIIWNEAKVVHYDSVVPANSQSKNVFGDDANALKAEEDRILKHMKVTGK